MRESKLNGNGGCVFTCGGCGASEGGFANRSGDWFKPGTWFQRTDDDGTQMACSRSCINRIADRTGKTGVVLPV